MSPPQYIQSVQSQGSESAALRGWAARCMIAEDAHWAMDIGLSLERVPAIKGCVPLIIGHHLARIAYEGAAALRSQDSNLGIPLLSRFLNSRFDSITARARHASKLLDNSSTSYDEVLVDLDNILKVHGNKFTGNTLPWLRWLENDLGLYCYKGKLIGATIPVAYRLSLELEDGGRIAGESVREVSEEWGATLAVLGAADLQQREPCSSIDFSRIGRIKAIDRLVSGYLKNRFESDFPVGLKLLLLAIEGDLNTSRLFIPHSAMGHELAAFRAQAVTAYHSLTTLRKICDRFPEFQTSGISGLRSLLDAAPAQRLVSREGVRVRDRCVHYPILNPTLIPDPSLPMFGVVEALYPGNTWERYYGDVIYVTNRISDYMDTWESTPGGSVAR